MPQDVIMVLLRQTRENDLEEVYRRRRRVEDVHDGARHMAMIHFLMGRMGSAPKGRQVQVWVYEDNEGFPGELLLTAEYSDTELFRSEAGGAG